MYMVYIVYKGRRHKQPICYGPVRNVLLWTFEKKYFFFYNFLICISKDAEWSKTCVFFFMKEKKLWF